MSGIENKSRNEIGIEIIEDKEIRSHLCCRRRGPKCNRDNANRAFTSNWADSLSLIIVLERTRLAGGPLFPTLDRFSEFGSQKVRAAPRPELFHPATTSGRAGRACGMISTPLLKTLLL
ncbi:hypothetical protein EVAR_29216_1 [Eumeta japonica]|uniref:Uncharacterized protein n=1 Tax=Eumeta variegata TaxID=151549 RepID=A0A4C1VHZ4_EUMVA|nr:hypothetical protein EVAR_29216_1 [Eumeta japonica]